ncbi:MAG: Rpn family recombination-promoting nuclease/putative transposase [Lachnospiraceae bacterium]|nr:Rpn family recombination-promoting nuclease/putative transposase [Lachnospiraceae bacterium]
MGEKDKAENYLEAYNDVFADIVNVLLFDGKRIMNSNQLRQGRERAVYKADGELHEEERDILKYWKRKHVCISVYGIENQTKIDSAMPLRVIGYDGASYREQALKGAQKKKYPVITVVLYFGTDRPWRRPLKLSDCMDIPDELHRYFSDYQLNVFNIAFLPDETVGKFTSDFRIVADYFSQVRKNKEYVPSKETMKHVDAVLKLMSVMTGDHRFEKAQREGEVHNMCEVMDRVEQRGMQKGIRKGQILLIDALKRLDQGETREQLIADGMDEETVDMAFSFHSELNY